MFLWIQGIGELFKRYGSAFRVAWSHRRELEPVPRLPHEREFLPTELALRETPVSPAPRIAMWLLVTFAAIALLWSFFGRLDIVAVAQGKIVPNERIKTIQPMETAVVKTIHVTDGQEVEAGEVLIELDATAAGAVTKRLENDLQTALMEKSRSEAFLDGLDGGEPKLEAPEGVDPRRTREARRSLRSRWSEFRANLDRIEAEIAKCKSELLSTAELVMKYDQTLPIMRHREEVFKKLYEGDIVSEQDYLERKRALLEGEGDRASLKEKILEHQATIDEAERRKKLLIAETRRTVLDRLEEAEQKIAANEQELIKAKQRRKLMKLRAPVSGTVQQLAVHTVGGVVTPAQALMVVVPKEDALEVEAFLENKDIGFVEAGQEAEVKIETFNYTKYGTIPGEVKTISDDAVQDEKRGLIYAARVRLSKATVHVGEKPVNLSPGMAVTVEIKTGKRRVIEYLLTPLLRYADESMKER